MSWFSLGRSEGFPAQYGPNATSVTVDLVEIGIIAGFAILFLTFLVAFVPTRTWKSNLPVAVRATVSLFIGFALLYGNFGQEWERGEVTTTTPYKAGSAAEINASIELKIGLRGVNITLRNASHLDNDLNKEIINYNERFTWEWDQGRIGFGPYASSICQLSFFLTNFRPNFLIAFKLLPNENIKKGTLCLLLTNVQNKTTGVFQQEFRKAQYHGTPTPILWVAEYFLIDGEGFRFGRFYRTAGWFTHIALWTAFSCWIIANILFKSLISYGAYFLACTGGLQLLGVLVWTSVRNYNELFIPFADGNITTKYGSTYWLTFASGIFSVALAAIILFLDYKYEAAIHRFFCIDLLHAYNEVYLSKSEFEQLHDPIYDSVILPTQLAEADKPIFLKRRSNIALKRASKLSKVKRGRENLLAQEFEMSSMSPCTSTRRTGIA